MRFQKIGLVEVGTADPSQKITLKDPIGEAHKLEFDLKTGACTMTVYASDDRNAVVRSYPIALDADFAIALHELFENHVRRVARESFNEFKDLIELDNAKNNK
jgi:hypothetical protein